MIIQKKLSVSTKGFNDIKDITPFLREYLLESKLTNGNVLVFVPGSTGGLTTIEYEPGLLQDFPEMLEKIAPMNVTYQHDNTWHDGKGYAHRDLINDEMTTADKILAVADIFEALGAHDRPYRGPNTLNEIMRILMFMVKDRHLDKDIVRLFIEEKLCIFSSLMSNNFL